MRANVSTQNTNDASGYQIWKNPVDNVLYGSYSAPKYGFKEADAWPIYDLGVHSSNIKMAKEGNGDYMREATIDSEFRNLVDEYKSNVMSGGRQRQAALRSEKNSAVNIVNVWTEVLGKLDRTYAGKNLAREIPTPNLLIEIDTVTKYTGLTKLDEGMLPQNKELTYARQSFRAEKYGLKFSIHEEARLVNVHNVLQDSIQVAQKKIEQKQSFDVINAALTGLTTQTGTAGNWEAFVSTSADRSTNSPLKDIGITQLNIEGSGVGGKMDRVGMHQLTYADYLGNTYLRGVASTGSLEYSFEPGTSSLKGIDGLGLVMDNSITQGKVICTSVATEPTIAFFQGPQRIGSAHDEETGDDKYFVIDYHKSAVIQPETGKIIDSASTPVAW
jgi:hypothetical protein